MQLGSRATNGVVMVTTKRGKIGKVNIIVDMPDIGNIRICPI